MGVSQKHEMNRLTRLVVAPRQCAYKFNRVAYSNMPNKPRVTAYQVAREEFVAKSGKLCVILTENIRDIGDKGEELVVSKGYARNFLFPKKLAVYATKETREQYEPFAKLIDYEAREREKELKAAKKRVDKIVVKFKRQKLDDGSLHAPVTANNVSDKLARQYQIRLEPERVRIGKEIARYGEHEVRVMIEDGIEVPLKILV